MFLIVNGLIMRLIQQIGVKPWGQERIPKKVQGNADVMIGWNFESVVSAVRNYAL